MATTPEEYKVQLEVFEGPLDLLLYLIRKEEIDIHDIPIEQITAQYLHYIDLMRVLDLNVTGEFLVMAATLLMIKSRLLLPPEEREVPDAEEEEEDPRWDLVRQLVEYKKFKDAALQLHQLEELRLDAFVREGDVVHWGPASDLPLEDVGLFDLLSAFNQALQRVGKEDLQEIFSEHFTVGEKIDALLDLVKSQKRVLLSSVFSGMRSRAEIVVTFLAMLELIRLRQITACQDRAFGEIFVESAAETE